MLISFDWLKEYIEIKEPIGEISDLLTASGLEVEGVEEKESIPGGLKGVVIGEVLTCGKHPDADRLSVTSVDLGGDEPKQIVCGAPNVAAGQKVVVATVGTMMYPEGHDPFKIKKSKIRGEVSEGMICAEDELGMGQSHDGIMVLDTNLPNGTPAADLFQLGSDQIIEIGLTPNRADATSHVGTARDLKALLDRPVNWPSVDKFKVEQTDKPIKITVENTDACPRYTGLTISGITVKDSPEWLQKRLKSIGINPTNNIVDVTNFVLHEVGQPLHAFDLDQVDGGEVIVKNLPAGTKFKTLDDVERKLLANDLMICNAKAPMCIAGVLGGIDSGVSENTKSIFLESAYFAPETTRMSSMKHAIKTDASFRFERGTDPNICEYALKRAALLIQEVAGGSISSEITDVYPNPIENFVFDVKYSYLRKIIGRDIDLDVIKKILINLDINVENESGDLLTVSVPPYRVDVQRPADIAEEILRIYGYNNIEVGHLSTEYFAEYSTKEPHQIKEKLADLLSARGYNEIITNSLTNSKYYSEKENLVNILNYNSADLDVMRKSMLYSGLEALKYNLNRRQNNLKFYEFGKTYAIEKDKYSENEYLSIYCTGREKHESWKVKSKAFNFSALYSDVNDILNRLGLESVESRPLESKNMMGLELMLNSKRLVELGTVDHDELEKFEINQEVFFASFNWKSIFKAIKEKVKFKSISKFPEVRRDLSIVLDKSISFEEVKRVAEKAERKILKQINVFDVYEGDKLEKGKKSYSVSFILLDDEKTLNDKMIDKTMSRLIKAYESELQAVIRQ